MFKPHISCSEYVAQFNSQDTHLIVRADDLIVNNAELITGWWLVAATIVSAIQLQSMDLL